MSDPARPDMRRLALASIAGTALVSATMSQQDLLTWGWRLPLVASAVLVGFGLWVRVHITQTPRFLEAQRAAPVARAPLGDVLIHRWRGLLVAGGSRVGPDVLFSLVAVFSLTYVTTILGLSATLATAALSIGAVYNAASVPLAGILSDRFGRRRVYGLAATVSLAGCSRCFRCWTRAAPRSRFDEDARKWPNRAAVRARRLSESEDRASPEGAPFGLKTC
jgi:MFS family permease